MLLPFNTGEAGSAGTTFRLTISNRVVGAAVGVFGIQSAGSVPPGIELEPAAPGTVPPGVELEPAAPLPGTVPPGVELEPAAPLPGTVPPDPAPLAPGVGTAGEGAEVMSVGSGLGEGAAPIFVWEGAEVMVIGDGREEGAVEGAAVGGSVVNG